MSLGRAVKGAVFSGVAALERILRIGGAGATEPLSKIVNFLVLQHPTALGTAVHATPLIPALREAIPGCRIVVAASGLAVEIFRCNPGIDRLIVTPSPLHNLISAAESLRTQTPFVDETFAALTTRGNERTLIGLQALLSGSAIRVGFTEVPQLYRSPLHYDPQRSLIDNNLSIVEALEHRVRHFEPEMFFTQADVNQARRILSESGAGDHQPTAIFVTQNSGGQRTGWHLDRFIQVIRHASERLGCAVIYVGTAKDEPAIEAIRQAAGNIGISIAGRTNVAQLAAVLALSDVMVTLDTGTLHVGRAARTPMVVLGPSWQRPIEWLPLDIANVRILRGQDRAEAPENYRLDEISVESVIATLEELLHAYPACNEDRERRVAQSLSTITHLAS